MLAFPTSGVKLVRMPAGGALAVCFTAPLLVEAATGIETLVAMELALWSAHTCFLHCLLRQNQSLAEGQMLPDASFTR